MIKIIVYLFLVTLICCLAQEDNKNYKEDEIDLTTLNPKYILTKDIPKDDSSVPDSPKIDDKSVPHSPKIDDKSLPHSPKIDDKLVPDSPKVDEKPVPDSPKYDEKAPEYDSKEVPKDLPKEEVIPQPDIKENEEPPKQPHNKEKLPVNYDTDIKSEKPVDNNPGFDSKGEEVDEKIIKKVEKPLHSEPEIDLGKDYKKPNIDKPQNNPKDSEKEIPYQPNAVPDSDKDQNSYGGGDVKPNKDIGGEEEYGPEKEKGYKPSPNSHNKKEVETGNEIIDNLLKLIKSDYRSDFEQVKLGDFQPFNHGNWGSVTLNSGVVTGLTNVERAGSVVVIDEYENKKLIITDIAVKDVTADYKLNAKLFHRITFKDRELKLLVKKAVVNIKLEVDKNQKKLIVKELNLNSFDGLSVKSGGLFWPFNTLTNAIVKNQEQVIKDLITKEFSKYMGKAVENIQFDELFAKLY